MTNDENVDIDILIRRCIANRPQARRKFFDRFGSKVMSICRRYTYSNEEADVIFQKSFINIFNSLNKYNSATDSIDSWICSLTVNVVLEEIKEKFYEPKTVSDASVGFFNPKEELTPVDLLHFMDQLSFEKRLVFNLYVIDGYSHEQIGQLLDISQGVSRYLLSRAKDKLAELHKRQQAFAKAFPKF
ncbi:MAG TPA: sigma-70 family RNA polymerase sigma factor [Cytophagaceae bacterium]